MARSRTRAASGASSCGCIGSAKGVADRASCPASRTATEAERLRGLRLYLPRSALPPTGEDEYYHADLIGLEAVLGDGTPVGRVRAIHDFGAGDTLELGAARRAAGDGAVHPRGRAGGRRLPRGGWCVDPPPGLLDDAEPTP